MFQLFELLEQIQLLLPAVFTLVTLIMLFAFDKDQTLGAYLVFTTDTYVDVELVALVD